MAFYSMQRIALAVSAVWLLTMPCMIKAQWVDFIHGVCPKGAGEDQKDNWKSILELAEQKYSGRLAWNVLHTFKKKLSATNEDHECLSEDHEKFSCAECAQILKAHYIAFMRDEINDSEQWIERYEVEGLGTKTFGAECTRHESMSCWRKRIDDEETYNKPVVFILGPSASGKSSKGISAIEDVLVMSEAPAYEGLGKTAADGGCSVTFNIIDGGILREASVLEAWTSLVKLANYLKGVSGFSDAYTMMKDNFGTAKSILEKRYETDAFQGNGLIIPTTATKQEKVKDQIIRFQHDGALTFHITMYVHQVNAYVRGTRRALEEGKQYDGKNWMASLQNAANLIKTEGLFIFGALLRNDFQEDHEVLFNTINVSTFPFSG